MMNHRFTNVAASLLFVVFVSGSFTSATASGLFQPSWMNQSDEVLENLRKVYEIGKEVGHAETLQAILLQESGGAVKQKQIKVSRSLSYGVMQVQIIAARAVFRGYPLLVEKYFSKPDFLITDREIVDLLVNDDDANIRIAAYHFDQYLKQSNGNWSRAVAAYNVGIGAVTKIGNPAEHKYVRAIKTRLKLIKPFNALNGLELTEPI